MSVINGFQLNNFQKERLIPMEYPQATILLEDGRTIVLELYPDIAPNTAYNFIELAQTGFFEGIIFHRVVPDFVIQGGDPTGLGQGTPGYTIPGEFAANGFENRLIHDRGVVSMARWSDFNSAGSQFFITVKKTARLDGEYAAFGKVISGMDVVDAISVVHRNYCDMPYTPIRIKKVTITPVITEYPVVVKLSHLL